RSACSSASAKKKRSASMKWTLAQEKGGQVEPSRDPPNRLARGESAVQADGAHSELLLLRERGAPVEIVYAGEGTPLIIAPSAVFKTALSPNAARQSMAELLKKIARGIGPQ